MSNDQWSDKKSSSVIYFYMSDKYTYKWTIDITINDAYHSDEVLLM